MEEKKLVKLDSVMSPTPPPPPPPPSLLHGIELIGFSGLFSRN